MAGRHEPHEKTPAPVGMDSVRAGVPEWHIRAGQKTTTLTVRVFLFFLPTGQAGLPAVRQGQFAK
jgi:hypothetical protein